MHPTRSRTSSLITGHVRPRRRKGETSP
jgi:hypothetical protein